MNGEEKPIRLVIVEDEAYSRAYLIPQLNRREEINIVGEASNGTEAVNIIQKERPDMALIDFHLKGKPDGYTLLQKAKIACPSLKIATLTADTNQYLLSLAVEYGADSIIIKSEKPFGEQICKVLTDMKLDIYHFPEEEGLNQKMMLAILERQQFEKALNETQKLIIALLAMNKSYDEIAMLLEKNVNHIRNSIANAIKSLHVTEIPKKYPKEVYLEIDTKESLIELFQKLYPRFDASLLLESFDHQSKAS